MRALILIAALACIGYRPILDVDARFVVTRMPPMRFTPILATALLLAVAPARAEEPAAPAPAPSSGTTFLVLGSLGIAAGVGNLATAPLCTLAAIRATAQPACIGTSIGFGVAFLGAGIPLVVLGAGRRAAWLKSVTVVPTTTGAAVSYTRSW